MTLLFSYANQAAETLPLLQKVLRALRVTEEGSVVADFEYQLPINPIVFVFEVMLLAVVLLQALPSRIATFSIAIKIIFIN